MLFEKDDLDDLNDLSDLDENLEKEEKKSNKIEEEDLNIAGAFREDAQPITMHCKCGYDGVVWSRPDAKEIICPQCHKKISGFFG
ncbi:MAG: hypothetical protein LBJ32_00060 [Oscillospiraceae bacterium]|jgi:hypothetical protein|nr:hypothetical protein [Oscillospiraceae bacterium]